MIGTSFKKAEEISAIRKTCGFNASNLMPKNDYLKLTGDGLSYL